MADVIIVFIFYSSLILNIILSIKLLWNKDKYKHLAKDREKIKTQYIELHNRFYKPVFKHTDNYVFVEYKLKDDIKEDSIEVFNSGTNTYEKYFENGDIVYRKI